MNECRSILKELGMFVTDVDGTLLGHRAGFDQCQAFRQHIDTMRNRYGIKWVICTGRSLRSFMQVFRPMVMLGIVPDYVIARHAYIYERRSYGYVPHLIWNVRVRWLQWSNEWKVRRAIPEMGRAMLRRNPFARVVYRNRHRIAFQFEDDGAARFGVEIVKEVAQATRYLQVFEYPCEVDVHAIPFTKGLAVSELARRLGIPAAKILVVGDGHNDISMMVPDVAKWTSCPVNAATEVVETVHKTSGHIASERSLLGVLEILDAYEKGELNSQFPASWVEGGDATGGLPHRRQAKEGFGGRGLLLVGLSLYVVLMVLATFELIPDGGRFMAPLHRAIDFVEKLIHANPR